MQKLKISEIFSTIQGEGVTTGKPSIFLRMNLCNLHCIWCDTPYTWNWTTTKFKHPEKFEYAKEVKEMTVEEVYSLIKTESEKNGFITNLVLTGGEPTLQSSQLFPLLQMLKDDGWTIEVETNGTIIPAPEFVVIIDQWNISPKLDNSNNSVELREIPSAYKFYRMLDNAWFKFVVTDTRDFEEVKNLIDRYDLKRENVLIMPEARTKEELREKTQWIVEKCKKYGFNFTSRLQVEVWGAKRGV